MTWSVEVVLTGPDGARTASHTATEDESEVVEMITESAKAVADLWTKS